MITDPYEEKDCIVAVSGADWADSLRCQSTTMVVSPERLAPFVARFLVRQAEMLRNKEAFVEKHHPLSCRPLCEVDERKLKGKKKRR